MLRSIIKSFKPSTFTSTASSSSTRTIKPIKIYHNTNSLYSLNLLTKLTNFNNILDVTVCNNEQLSQQDYNFIIDECLSMHPDNKSIMLQLFHPSIQQVCKSQLIRDFSLHDLIYDYNNLSNVNSNNTNGNQLPLIIDFNSKLIANDDATIDRILVNYLTCGIQSTTNTKPPSNTNTNTNTNITTNTTNYTSSLKNHDLVHPHVAEFADLF